MRRGATVFCWTDDTRWTVVRRLHGGWRAERETSEGTRFVVFDDSANDFDVDRDHRPGDRVVVPNNGSEDTVELDYVGPLYLAGVGRNGRWRGMRGQVLRVAADVLGAE